MGECFNCTRSAQRRYTVVLEGGATLPDRPMCPACFAFFAESDHLKVFRAAAVARSGGVPGE